MRSTLLHRVAVLALGFLLSAVAWAAQGDGASGTTPAEAARKALDAKITLDYVGQSLEEVVEHLRQKTKINFMLDGVATQRQGRLLRGGFNPAGAAANPQPLFHLEVKGARLRQGLHSFLDEFSLTYVLLADGVLITTEAAGFYRQLRQRVSVDGRDRPLRDVLQELARETGVNLVIDPTVGKDVAQKTALRVDDTTVETAVGLLTELAGLKSVQFGNVLLVTSEERAAKIRKEGNAGNSSRPPPSSRFSPAAAGELPGFGGGPGGLGLGGFGKGKGFGGKKAKG